MLPFGQLTNSQRFLDGKDLKMRRDVGILGSQERRGKERAILVKESKGAELGCKEG